MAIHQRDEDASGDSRRRGRLRCEDLTSNLGEVQDLSASGLRILGRRSDCPDLEASVDVRLAGPGGHVDVACRVVWIRTVGFNRRELGLAFVDPGQGTRQEIAELARATRRGSGFAPEPRSVRGLPDASRDAA